mgnify:CR=1 FL=1
MKKLILSLITLLVFSNVCFSQNSMKPESIGEPKIFVENNSFKSEPFETSSRMFSFYITVESDFVESIGSGCWTVNVRVYFNTEDGKVLMANQNVNVGSGCPQNRMSIETATNCPTTEFKGDIILEGKDSYKYCLIELLKDDAIYNVYERMKKEFIKRYEQK